MKNPGVSLDLRSYADESTSHQHNHHQLVLPMVGCLELSVEQTGGEVHGGQVAVIASAQDHGFAASGHNHFLVADVPAVLAPTLERLPLIVDLDPALLQYRQFMYTQMCVGNTSPATEQQMLLLFVQLLQERYGDQVRVDRRVKAARQFLDDHYHRNVTMDELAAVACLSVRQLNELFRNQLGKTPHQYLVERRMQQAWQMLERSDLSVQQIADAVGYSSLSAFSDRFSRHFGKPPSYFRRKGK